MTTTAPSTAVDIVAESLLSWNYDEGSPTSAELAARAVRGLVAAGFIPDVVTESEDSRMFGAAVSAVRAIHEPRSMIDGYGMPSGYCVECRQTWPCATIAAVDGATFVDAEIVDDDAEEPF